jgi:hypothetical protein
MCSGFLAFRASPYALCFDAVSGHVPQVALNRFLSRLIEETVAKNYVWLATITRNSFVKNELELVQPNITRSYAIVSYDDFAAAYQYRLRFDNGYVVDIGLMGSWPECPDNNVTDQEVFGRLQLWEIHEDKSS